MALKGSATASYISKRNEAVLSVLCKHLSLDPKDLRGEDSAGTDLKNLFLEVLHSRGDGFALENEDQVMKWVEFASSLPVGAGDSLSRLREFDEDLSSKSVLLGGGLKPSIADFAVFAALHSSASCLSKVDQQKLPNLMRWIDYMQDKEEFGGVFEKISIQKTNFEPHVPKAVEKAEVVQNSKKGSSDTKTIEKIGVESNANKGSSEVVGNKKATEETKKKANLQTEETKKTPEREPNNKDAEPNVSLLNIQVGIIRKAWKHPTADSLIVEEIDLGDGNMRQVVSGLAKYFEPEQLVNRRVVLVTNVKAGKLRDVMSAGLVLCASNQDQSVVEPLLPPDGAKLGERISFSGFEGKPEDVLNPKKKQLEKITPFLCTDDKGVATYRGVPFMTSLGPCTSALPNASIK